MSRDSIKIILLKFSLLALLLVPTSNSFAESVECEKCKVVPGMPKVETNSLEKVVEGLPQGINYKPLSEYDIGLLCKKFIAATTDGTIKVFLSKLKTNSQDPIEVFTRINCTAKKAYASDFKIPIIHYIPEFPSSMSPFLKQIYEYFVKKENNKSAWLKIINLKNQKDMTLLDLVNQESKQPNLTPEANSLFKEMREFLCKNGGEFSFYNKEERCNNDTI